MRLNNIRRASFIARLFGSPANYARLARAQVLARDRGASVPQIGLAFLLSQEFPVFPIIGTRRLDHFRENVAALDLGLSAAELAWLD